MLFLKPSLDQEDEGELAHFDIKTEIDEFEKDLKFLKFIQSDDVYNVEQFINVNTYSTMRPNLIIIAVFATVSSGIG